MLEGKKDGWKALIALAPALVILIVFTFIPIINTTLTAFLDNWSYSGLVNSTTKVCTEYNANGVCIFWESPRASVTLFDRIFKIFAFNHAFDGFGVQSFVTVLKDSYFWNALKNTFIMVLISVPLTVIVGLLVSVCLNSIKKLQGLFQTVFFLPYVTNTIALGMVFQIMFSRDNGLINSLLNFIGKDGVNWIGVGSGYWAGMFVITIYTLWNGLAFKILVLLSGLQSIDKQYYQAAQIDGASKIKTFFKINKHNGIIFFKKVNLNPYLAHHMQKLTQNAS